MTRRLKRHWQTPHRLIYLIATLGVWPFWPQIKKRISTCRLPLRCHSHSSRALSSLFKATRAATPFDVAQKSLARLVKT
jgi:DMSO/TMAO reductase YedYZ heme-binding membrane subunit